MAIDCTDYIIKNKSKKKISYAKFFRCICDKCSSDRGYLAKSRAQGLCKKCAMTSEEYIKKQQLAITGKKFGPCSQSRKDKISKANKGNIKNLDAKIRQSCSYRKISLNEFNGFAKDSLQNKIAHNLRSRLGHAIKNSQKAGSAVKDLGCSIEELKKHLESQFEPWMNWDNYGKYQKDKLTWNIDHKRPLNSFDLSNREEFLVACSYTNLQPMLAHENSIIKRGRIDYGK
jgi:hypothetical protein